MCKLQLQFIQIDHDPDGNIPQGRRNYGAAINARENVEYDGERMNFEEDEDEELGGVEARRQFIEGSFRQNV